MPGPARVNSIQALREFRSALAVFADECRSALESASSELNGRSLRISSDLPRQWQSEQRKNEELVVRCRIALEHAKSMADMGKSSVDERRALQRAKDNVENARTKLANTRRWSRELEKEISTYRGQTEPLARLVEASVPRAMQRLERMARELEKYTTVAPPDQRHSGASVERAAVTSTMSGEGSTGTTDERTRLFAQLPTPETIADAARHHDGALPALNLISEDRRTLALASGEHKAADLRADVAIACTPDAPHLVMQRQDPVDDTDSGWRLHTDPPAERWVRVPGVQLLRALPDLPSIARLPVGTTLTTRADRVSALFDTIGRDVWPHLRGPSEDAPEEPA